MYLRGGVIIVHAATMRKKLQFKPASIPTPDAPFLALNLYLAPDRLFGLVVKMPPPRERKIRGSIPPFRGNFFSGSSHTSDFKIGAPVAILPGAWRYIGSALGEKERERERGGGGGRETDRQTDRQADRQRERQRQIEPETYRRTDRQTDI